MAQRRPQDIGRAAENAVVAYLVDNGWSSAERRRLRGRNDAGDITGTPGVCWEVKGGAAAKLASDGQVEEWLDEAEKERVAAGADVGVLVLQRKGIGTANTGRWWAILPGFSYEMLTGARDDHAPGMWSFGDRGPLRMHLSQVCALLRYAGYGSQP